MRTFVWTDYRLGLSICAKFMDVTGDVHCTVTVPAGFSEDLVHREHTLLRDNIHIYDICICMDEVRRAQSICVNVLFRLSHVFILFRIICILCVTVTAYNRSFWWLHALFFSRIFSPYSIKHAHTHTHTQHSAPLSIILSLTHTHSHTNIILFFFFLF